MKNSRLNSPYPYSINEQITYQMVVIDEDRYSGAYSGGEWTAWRGPKPDDINAGDVTCEEFWYTLDKEFIFGKGKTELIAFLDLARKVEEVGFDFYNPLRMVLIDTFMEKDVVLVKGSAEYQRFVTRGAY